MNIDANLETYLALRCPDGRDSSFDYCFNYFQSHRKRETIDQLCSASNLELSCLHLGFYLASWGMFRGKSDLLKHSIRHLALLVEAIAEAPQEVWTLDVHRYKTDGEALLGFAPRIRSVLNHPSDILVTKILLGVFGCVPAFDTYFAKGFHSAGDAYRASKLDKAALDGLSRFYEAHAEKIDSSRYPTYEFSTQAEGKRLCSRAKVIDMIFFIEGGGRS